MGRRATACRAPVDEPASDRPSPVIWGGLAATGLDPACRDQWITRQVNPNALGQIVSDQSLHPEFGHRMIGNGSGTAAVSEGMGDAKRAAWLEA